MKKGVIFLAFVFRALETFWQAFVAYICLNIVVAAVGIDYSNEMILNIALIGLIIPVLIAIVSTVMNIKKMMPLIKKVDFLFK